MLKKGPEGRRYFGRLEKRKSYEQVHGIRSRSPEGSAERVYASIENRLQTRVQKVVDLYLQSASILDLAKLNDSVLRCVTSLPDAVRDNSQLVSLFYQKIRRTASDVIARRARAIDDDLAAGRIFPSEAHSEQERLQYTSVELQKSLESLESSVGQLVSVLRRRSEESPNSIFATSVDFDVRYGVDLIEGIPEINSDGDLILHIRLYQAKASRAGLTSEEVRKVGHRYRDQMQLASSPEHLAVDEKWLNKHIESEQSAEIGITFDQAIDILSDSADVMDQLLLDDEGVVLHPLREYSLRTQIYNKLEPLAVELEEDNPVSLPHILRGNVDVFYAVDTEAGLEILSQDEIDSYAA